jgi:Holliday junction DNA helicase RuvB
MVTNDATGGANELQESREVIAPSESTPGNNPEPSIPSFTMADRLRLTQMLNLHPNWIEVLKEGMKVEEAGEKEYLEKKYGNYYGWEWYSVHTPAQTLHKMVTERLLDITLSTRSGTHFRVCQPELVKQVIKDLESTENYVAPSIIPSEMFKSIVGYEDVKQLVTYAIDSQKPVHMLFTGPPASAKTLFLMELVQLPESYYLLAQTTTQAGLANVLFTNQPRFLLIDEIDRLSGEHVGVLNSLMATGIVSESKYGKTRGMQLGTKVFAAGIKYGALPADLLSRFLRIKFDPYDEPAFIKVASTVMVNTENCSSDVANYIAQEVWNRGHSTSDIRNCVQMARLSNGDMTRAKEIFTTLK